VFAVTAGAFVPLNFIAVRLSTAYVHPRVLGSTSNLPAQMALTFVVSLIAFALLYATLCGAELATKRARFQLKALRRHAEAAAGEGEQPAAPRRAGARTPLHGAGTLAAPAQRGGA
jgi:heme exporter protein C